MSPLPLKLSGRAVIWNEQGQLLLVRRVGTARTFPSQWEFPGGKGEPHEDFADALQREVHEETGLRVELGRVLGANEAALPQLRVAFVYVEARPAAGRAEVRLSSEHDAFSWVEPDRLADYEMPHHFRVAAASFALRSG